jgi:hypothetical protein
MDEAAAREIEEAGGTLVSGSDEGDEYRVTDDLFPAGRIISRPRFRADFGAMFVVGLATGIPLAFFAVILRREVRPPT